MYSAWRTSSRPCSVPISGGSSAGSPSAGVMTTVSASEPSVRTADSSTRLRSSPRRKIIAPPPAPKLNMNRVRMLPKSIRSFSRLADTSSTLFRRGSTRIMSRTAL